MNIDRDSRREWRRSRRNYQGNRVFTGVFLLVAGAVLFLQNFNTGLPGWLFTWQMFLIGLGIFLGLRHNFKGPAWFILILIGAFSLQDEVFPDISLKQFTWPVILAVLGVYFILRPQRRVGYSRSGDDEDLRPIAESTQAEYFEGDRIDITSVFGSIKKVVVSKNFKGGEAVSFLGGSDINLSQADINGRVTLEVTNFMGGTKLVIPASWEVQSELVAIFGGVEDKRDIRNTTVDHNKVLVLEGTCIFGGIEIKNY